MKHQQSKLHYGNKGFVFTLDMLIAFTVFLIAFAISTYYVSQTSENKLNQLQMSTAASDLLAVLDNDSTLQSLNSTLIESEKNRLLTPAYDMRITIQTSDNETIDVGNVTPEGIFVATGQRYIAMEDNYAEANYWIWARQ